MEKRKIFGAIIGVIAFILFMAGATYAWFTWTSNNVNLSGTSGCFEIYYANGTAISGSITPSATYSGGKSTTVKLDIKSTCTTSGQATIKLTTNTETSPVLYGGALKYAVYKGSTAVSGGSGTITAAGTKDLATVELTKAASAQTTYTVYVWVDGALTDNTFVGATYSGYIHASATQTG